MDDWWIIGPEPWSRADWLSLGQLVFTILGFAIAIGQLIRTARASEASNMKIDLLQARLVGNDLLVSLPRLSSLEDNIDKAVKGGDSHEVARTLLAYSRGASELAAMLEVRPETSDEALVELLKQAGASALRARGLILKADSDAPSAHTGAAGAKIAKASVEASALVARLQRKVNADGTD